MSTASGDQKAAVSSTFPLLKASKNFVMTPFTSVSLGSLAQAGIDTSKAKTNAHDHLSRFMAPLPE
jgi:hypothetical protein